MGSYNRSITRAIDRGRALTALVLRELRDARVDRDISGASVARTVGMSPAQYSRIERGLTQRITALNLFLYDLRECEDQRDRRGEAGRDHDFASRPAAGA